jgi:hypothetical protein
MSILVEMQRRSRIVTRRTRLPPLPQQIKRLGREHDIAILATELEHALQTAELAAAAKAAEDLVLGAPSAARYIYLTRFPSRRGRSSSPGDRSRHDRRNRLRRHRPPMTRDNRFRGWGGRTRTCKRHFEKIIEMLG